mgnify:CR=1 FL=1
MTNDNRYITLEEAYYICGVLNTNIVVEYVTQSSDSRSISMDIPIKIPEYLPTNSDFVKLSKLSEYAHDLSISDKDREKITDEIEEIYLKICEYSE